MWYFVGGIGSDRDIKKVAGLDTAHRNVSAALVVGTSNFSTDPNVVVMLVVGALLMLIILMVLGGEMGRRSQSKVAEPEAVEASLS